MHVVIGEVVPKNLALEKADRLALLVAPALLVFLRISAPFVYRDRTVGDRACPARSGCTADTAAAGIRRKS